MHPAVGIDHAGLGVGAHAGGTNVVTAVGAKAQQVVFQRHRVELESADAGAPQLLVNGLQGALNRGDVFFAVAPVHLDARHAQSVALVSQCHAAVCTRNLFSMHFQAEAVGAVLQNDGWELALGKGAFAQPVRHKADGVPGVGHHVPDVLKLQCQALAVTIAQSLAVLVADEVPCQVQARQHAVAVRRVNDFGEVQAGHHVAHLQFALGLFAQVQSAAAIDPIGRDLIAMAHATDGAVDAQAAHIAGDVAHVVAPHHVVLVANALSLYVVGGQQQPRRFNPAHGQHHHPGFDVEALAIQGGKVGAVNPDAVWRQTQAHAIGLQHHGHIGRSGQPVFVPAAHVGGA